VTPLPLGEAAQSAGEGFFTPPSDLLSQAENVQVEWLDEPTVISLRDVLHFSKSTKSNVRYWGLTGTSRLASLTPDLEWLVKAMILTHVGRRTHTGMGWLELVPIPQS